MGSEPHVYRAGAHGDQPLTGTATGPTQAQAGRSGGAPAARARGAWLPGHSPLPRRLRAPPASCVAFTVTTAKSMPTLIGSYTVELLYPKAVCCATKGVHIAMASSLCHAPTWEFCGHTQLFDQARAQLPDLSAWLPML